MGWRLISKNALVHLPCILNGKRSKQGRKKNNIRSSKRKSQYKLCAC